MFELGLLTAFFDGWSYEEAIDVAAENGFVCAEVACWPAGSGSERKFAGVCHIDCERVIDDPLYAAHVKDYAAAKGIRLSALAFYPNTMDADPEKRSESIAHLKAVIEASAILGVFHVNTFVGRDQYKTVEENLKLFDEIWPELISFAEERKVKIGIENCPMLFGRDQWPGGQNLMSSPVLFRELFRRIPSEYFGLNFDPSHFLWQQMDYISAVREFGDRFFHVHFKDLRVYPDRLAQCGVMAYPLDYMVPKLPGLGDMDWSAFISALHDIGYEGAAVIELEDDAFTGSREDMLKAVRLSKRYLEQFVV